MISKQPLTSKQPLVSKQPSNHTTSGFSLIELLVVIVIIGILSAIMAPGWFAFANSRRATAANDHVLQVLRQAQAQATRTRQTQTVRFDVAANPPLIIYDGISVPVGENGLTQGMIGMGTVKNIGSIPGDCSGNANCIAFGADGTVLNLVNSAESASPITITVFAPNDAQASTKRCVMIRSLLGAMQSASGSDCN